MEINKLSVVKRKCIEIKRKYIGTGRKNLGIRESKRLNMSTSGKISLGILILLLIIGIFAPVLSKHPYNIPSGAALEAPTKAHILGTDDLGIDLWAQICIGTRISIIVGFGTALLAGVGGGIIGIICGYYGGIVDRILMRITDIMIILPDLPLMIIIGAFFGPSIFNIIIVLSLFSWTTPARIVRAKVMSVTKEDYIIAAKSYGGGFYHITKRHILREVFPVLMVSIIKLVNKAIIAEASLSFLGLGDPNSKSWGIILNHAMGFQGIYFTEYWKWWIVSPLVAITVTVMSIAFLGREIEKI